MLSVCARLSLLLVVAATVLLIVCEPAFAQCAMCKTSLAGSEQGAQAARIINSAILVLLIPPVAIMTVILRVAFKSSVRPYVGRTDVTDGLNAGRR